MNIGLVLTGGGARAAYQAGVLKGIAEILGGKAAAGKIPFNIVAGVSAGAINGAYLGARIDNLSEAAQKMAEFWSNLTPGDVMRTDPASLGTIGFRWLGTLSFGGLVRRSRLTHLLDTEPLRHFLEKRIDFEAIESNVQANRLRGIAVSCTNYRTGTSVSFYSSNNPEPPWTRSARLGRRVKIEMPHILASSAIPVLFKPVKIEESFYGDGGIRLSTPLSPAIHLGADRLLAIGIRFYRSEALTRQLNETSVMPNIAMADVAGTLMNAIFLDSLDSDVERMERINRTLSMIPGEKLQQAGYPLRKIPVLAIRPSIDLGSLVAKNIKMFPWTLRYMMRGLGASSDRGWDFLSYLAFDSSYTRRLIELGHADAFSHREKIQEFFT